MNLYCVRLVMGYAYVQGKGANRKSIKVSDMTLIHILTSGDVEYIKAPHYENGKPADL